MTKSLKTLKVSLLPKKNKWLLNYSYNPRKRNTKQHISNISKGLNELNSKHDDTLIIDDLNSEMSEPSLDEFRQICTLGSIVNKPTYLKNKNLSCFYKMVVSVFKTNFEKQKPDIVTCRDYKRFNNLKFKENLIIYFSTEKNISYDAFVNLLLHTISKNGTNKTKAHQR